MIAMLKNFAAGIKEMWMKSPAASTVVVGLFLGTVIGVSAIFANSEALSGALAERISNSSDAVVEAVDGLKEAVRDVRAELQDLNERLEAVEEQQDEDPE